MEEELCLIWPRIVDYSDKYITIKARKIVINVTIFSEKRKIGSDGLIIKKRKRVRDDNYVMNFIAAIKEGAPYSSLLRQYCTDMSPELALQQRQSKIYCDHDLGVLYFDKLNISWLSYFGPHEQVIHCNKLTTYCNQFDNLMFDTRELKYHAIFPNVVKESIIVLHNTLAIGHISNTFLAQLPNLCLLIHGEQDNRTELLYTRIRKHRLNYIIIWIQVNLVFVYSNTELILPEKVANIGELKQIILSLKRTKSARS